MANTRQEGKPARTGIFSSAAGSARFLRLLLPLLLLAVCLFQVGCLSGLLRLSSKLINPGITTSSSAQSTATKETYVSPTPKATATVPAIPFDQQVSQLLLDGLQKRQREIYLDAAIGPRSISETRAQEIIDQIYRLYQDIYHLHAEFYYLDGSIKISYTIQEGSPGLLKTMTIKPQYLAATKNLSDAELDRVLAEVDSVVEATALKIRQKTAKPWEQLLLAHDYLVQNIAYDVQQNQDNNQAISAILDGITLCQGYAKAYQMIGQKLGYDVRVIGGESDGVGHAWNLVKLDGKFYHVDVTYDDPVPDGGTAHPVQHIHFMRSDAMMRETHQWEKAEYPACPTDGAFYYYQNNLLAKDRTDLNQKIAQFVQAINFKTVQTNSFEVLFTGQELPDQISVEQLLKSELQDAAPKFRVYYRVQIAKKIISIDITPEH